MKKIFEPIDVESGIIEMILKELDLNYYKDRFVYNHSIKKWQKIKNVEIIETQITNPINFQKQKIIKITLEEIILPNKPIIKETCFYLLEPEFKLFLSQKNFTNFMGEKYKFYFDKILEYYGENEDGTDSEITVDDLDFEAILKHEKKYI